MSTTHTIDIVEYHNRLSWSFFSANFPLIVQAKEGAGNQCERITAYIFRMAREWDHPLFACESDLSSRFEELSARWPILRSAQHRWELEKAQWEIARLAEASPVLDGDTIVLKLRANGRSFTLGRYAVSVTGRLASLKALRETAAG